MMENFVLHSVIIYIQHFEMIHQKLKESLTISTSEIFFLDVEHILLGFQSPMHGKRVHKNNGKIIRPPPRQKEYIIWEALIDRVDRLFAIM